MEKTCVRFNVTGKVQGVWFRASTQKQAKLLGITGYAKNMPNGSVEVLACGALEDIIKLETWLWEGPTKANVDNVSREPIAFEEHTQFKTS